MNSRARTMLALAALVPLLLFGVIPLASLGVDAEFHALAYDRLLRTLALAVLTAVLAVSFGAPLAIALSRARHSFWRVALVAPLLVPTVMLGAGWGAALRPDGVFARACERWFGVAALGWIEALESLPGAAFVLAMTYFPIVALAGALALDRVPRAHFEAAQALGAGPWRAFRVAVGTLRNSVNATFWLVFVLAAGDCGVVTIFDVDVIGFDALTRLTAFPDFGAAFAAALPLAAIGIVGGCLEARFAARSVAIRDEARMRAAGWSADFVLAIAIGVLVLPPFLAWIAELGEGDLAQAATLAEQPAIATLRQAGAAAFVATTIGGLLAWARAVATNRLERRLGRAAVLAAFSIFALPSVLLAIGAHRVLAPVSADSALLAAVLGVRQTLVSFLILAPVVSSSSRDGIDAAETLGAPPATIAWRIVLPRLAPSLVATFLLTALLSAGDLGAAALLHAPGEESLAVALLSFEANAPRGVVAGFALLSSVGAVAVGLFAFFLVRRSIKAS
jgi:iron(III) transport system permease protein